MVTVSWAAESSQAATWIGWSPFGDSSVTDFSSDLLMSRIRTNSARHSGDGCECSRRWLSVLAGTSYSSLE